jgi:hypothetical protein
MPRRGSPRARAGVLLAFVVLLIALGAGPAWADGDPASDVLVSQSAFVPPDAHVPVAVQERLLGVLSASARAGYPLKVAIIDSPADLGSISQLWRAPQPYAHFVGVELSGAAPSRVLVVMPSGFGLYEPGVSEAGAEAQLARTPPPPKGPDLGIVAADAVQLLARYAGHPIAASGIVAPSAHVPAASSEGVVTWLVLIAGAVLILLAWTFSLRARPLRVNPEQLK